MGMEAKMKGILDFRFTVFDLLFTFYALLFTFYSLLVTLYSFKSSLAKKATTPLNDL